MKLVNYRMYGNSMNLAISLYILFVDFLKLYERFSWEWVA